MSQPVYSDEGLDNDPNHLINNPQVSTVQNEFTVNTMVWSICIGACAWDERLLRGPCFMVYLGGL